MPINLAKFRNEIVDESINFLGLGIINDRSRNYKSNDPDDQEVAGKQSYYYSLTCHGFLEEAPEDILLEIFIRLPDSRSAIRSAIVCHSWHSLISHNPRFIPRFISHHHQHQHRYSLPYAIVFRKADRVGFAGVQYFQPIYKLFSEDSTFCTSPNFLDFLTSSPMVIRGSCNDLLLVSPGSIWSTDLYVCNPITKQFIQLPEMPRPHRPSGRKCPVTGHALVCMPTNNNHSQFKVVEFHHPRHPEASSDLSHNTVQPIKVFCSESRKWEMRHFHYPRPRILYAVNLLHAVACNGILYWLENERVGVDRVISLDLWSSEDLSNCQCGVIDFPDDYCYDVRYVREDIGVVRVHGREELRLLQVILTTGMESTADLNVWKLSYNQDKKKDWVLVHKNKLKKPKKGYEAGPFVHPTNGDVVFVVWGTNEVYQYNLKDDTTITTYEMIGKLQEPLVLNNRCVTSNDRLLPFPVVHSNWPTLLPNNPTG